MVGMATLAMLVSSTCMKVPSASASATSALAALLSCKLSACEFTGPAQRPRVSRTLDRRGRR